MAVAPINCVKRMLEKAGKILTAQNGAAGINLKNNKYPKAFLANPSSRLAKNGPARARKKSRSRLRDAMNKRLAPAVAATTISPMDGQPISAPAANVNELAIGREKATTAI